jgi:hypothetical protein
VDEVAPHLLCESGPDGMAESWPVGGEKRMRVGSAQSAVRHTVDVAASLPLSPQRFKRTSAASTDFTYYMPVTLSSNHHLYSLGLAQPMV